MFGIDVGQDRAAVHPPAFCNTCYAKAVQARKKWVDSAQEVHEWTEHPMSDGNPCSTCEFFTSQRKGGRPQKRSQKNRGRPSTSSNCSIADRVKSQAPPSWNAQEPLQPTRFLPSSTVSLTDMQCSFCECIADSPVIMPCRKIACARCVGEAVRKSKEHSLHCPCCKSQHIITDAPQFPPASDVVFKILGSMLLRCDIGVNALKWSS